MWYPCLMPEQGQRMHRGHQCSADLQTSCGLISSEAMRTIFVRLHCASVKFDRGGYGVVLSGSWAWPLSSSEMNSYYVTILSARSIKRFWCRSLTRRGEAVAAKGGPTSESEFQILVSDHWSHFFRSHNTEAET